MKDKSKKLLVINTGEKSEAAKPYAGQGYHPSYVQRYGGASSDMSGYLLKSIWSRAFELKTDKDGTEYLFTKLPLATQYGITMYANGGDMDIPSIYNGLPIDWKTLLRDENGVLMVNPDIEFGGGASSWGELEGKPDWITNTKPIYDYSEIKGTPDLSKYALSEDLKKYVSLDGYETINGLKNFTKGLQIDGLGITKSQDDVIYLDANLVVRGGITMFGTNSVDVPTIMDAIATDNVNLEVVDGVLTFVGASGGLTEVHWDDVIGRPTLLSSFIDDVVDGHYLPLSGGEINGSLQISNGSLALLGAKNSGASTISLEPNGNSYSAITVSRYGIDYNGILSILPKGGMIGVGLTNPEYKFHVQGDIFSSGMVIANNGIDSRGASSYGSLPYIRLHIPGLTYAQFLLNSNGAIELRFGDSTQTGGFVDFYSGNIVSSGGITMYSDIRKKTKLQDVELTLQQIANAPLIEHYYNSDEKRTTHVGSIAQYWASLNDWFCKLDGEGFYTMEIQNAALASAISIARELQRYESKTDKKIRLLKKRIGELEDKVEELEKKGA